MRSQKRFGRRAIVPALGVVLGTTAAVVTVSLSTAAAGPASDELGVFDATHLPPLLTVASDRVELAYEVHCALPGIVADAGCDVSGTVFARAVGDTAFAELPLDHRPRDGVRQLATVVPEVLAASSRGFEYFAVLAAAELGERLVIPAGGEAAPHVSRRLDGAVEVELGRHRFRGSLRAGARIASASWGDGPGQAGLEHGRNLDPIGASAFDVDSRGNVLLLDQAHRRLLRWREGAKTPQQVPVSVNSTLADLVAADDGSLFVLETTAPPGRNPLVRRFDDHGRELEAIEAERSPSQIRIDAHRGPVVLNSSSHLWMPVMIDGSPATPDEQRRRGRTGRRFRNGLEVVSLRHEKEIRIALVGERGVARSWRLTSRTPLAEIQLAEPLGQHVVLVVRVYEEGVEDEFVVMVLGRDGLVDRFALDSADWAETAPLGRFKLAGRSLYRLGSTSSGAFVEGFDLEVR